MSNEKADLIEQQREQTIEFGSAELKSREGEHPLSHHHRAD